MGIGKDKIIVLGITLSATVAIMGFSFSLAAFQATGMVDQMAGYQGLREKTIILDTYDGGTWNDPTKNWDFELDQSTFATYYMYAFKNSDSSVYDWIVGTVVTPVSTSNLKNHHLVAFQFDSIKYDRFNFVRFNPDGINVPSWDRESGSLWDQTSAQTYDSNFNYYTINTSVRIPNGDGYGHDTANVQSWGKISVVDGVLTLN